MMKKQVAFVILVPVFVHIAVFAAAAATGVVLVVVGVTVANVAVVAVLDEGKHLPNAFVIIIPVVTIVANA